MLRIDFPLPHTAQGLVKGIRKGFPTERICILHNGYFQLITRQRHCNAQIKLVGREGMGLYHLDKEAATRVASQIPL